MLTMAKEQETKSEKKQCHIHFLEGEKFKTNSISILWRMPLTRQNVTKTALLAEVLKNGCRRYPTRQKISQKMDDLYGSVFDISIIKKGNEQMIFFYLETLQREELWEEGFAFLRELLFHPNIIEKGFSETVIKQEKDRLRQKIRSRKDDKKAYAKQRCLEEVAQGDTFGLFADGYEEDLQQIDGELLYLHYRNCLKHCAVEILLCGKKEQKQKLCSLAEALPFFGDFVWKAEAEKERKHQKKREVVETLGLTQGRLQMAFRTGVLPESKAFFALLVCNEVLGGNPSSLLFQKVREQEGACYDIHSFVYRFYPILMVEAGIEQSYQQTAVEQIMKALQTLQEKGCAEEAVEQAKKGLVQYYAAMKDSQTATMNFVLDELLLRTNRSFTDFLREIQQVTREEVQQRAKALVLDTVYFLQ